MESLKIKNENTIYAELANKSKLRSVNVGKDFDERLLMFRKDCTGSWTRLHHAVRDNSLNCVKVCVELYQTSEPEMLLKRGRWGETALQLALRLERAPSMIKELLRGDGAEAVGMGLEEYFFKGDPSGMRYGLCFYPIHEAVSYKKHSPAFKVTQLLLDKDTDVDEMDCDGTTPLILAAKHGHLKVMKLLIKKGAVFDDRNDVWVLHSAVMSPDEADALSCLRYLTSVKKIDVNQKDPCSGWTALHISCAHFRVGVVQLLLSLGADVHAMDKKGQTALDLLHEVAQHPDNSSKAKKEYLQIQSLFGNNNCSKSELI